MVEEAAQWPCGPVGQGVGCASRTTSCEAQLGAGEAGRRVDKDEASSLSTMVLSQRDSTMALVVVATAGPPCTGYCGGAGALSLKWGQGPMG